MTRGNAWLRSLTLPTLLTLAVPLAAQHAGLEGRVAALRKSLAQNQARLRQYEWVEVKVSVQNAGHRKLEH